MQLLYSDSRFLLLGLQPPKEDKANPIRDVMSPFCSTQMVFIDDAKCLRPFVLTFEALLMSPLSHLACTITEFMDLNTTEHNLMKYETRFGQESNFSCE